MSLRPYRIDVPDTVLTDLHRRLEATRFPEPLPGPAWARGTPVQYVRELCSYWRHQYDWRKHEAALNAHPQFLCEVDGVDLHFWHVRGQGPSPLPLLLTHGWPGSMYEFHHLIGPLTNPAAHGGQAEDAFDVVIPALPGFGFGGKPREEGWDSRRIAAAFDALMVQHLGYPRYGAQGGDVGSMVSMHLGLDRAEHLVGLHLNMPLAQAPAGEEQSAEAQAFAARRAEWMAQEGGYMHEQGTKPESLALAQTDSPAGLAAWVVEKFRAWSDCGGTWSASSPRIGCSPTSCSTGRPTASRAPPTSTSRPSGPRDESSSRCACPPPRRSSPRKSINSPVAGSRSASTCGATAHAARRPLHRGGAAPAVARGRARLLPSAARALSLLRWFLYPMGPRGFSTRLAHC